MKKALVGTRVAMAAKSGMLGRRNGAYDVVAAESEDVLKGLRGACLVVEDLNRDAISLGVREERLRTGAELALRRSGFRVLTKDEATRSIAQATLYLSVQVVSTAFSYRLSLTETVTSRRSPTTTIVGATLWENNGLGTHGNDVDYIQSTAMQLVDMFVTDYTKGNRK